MVKQIVAMVVILTGMLCSANAVLADDVQRGSDDFDAKKWLLENVSFVQFDEGLKHYRGQGVQQDYKEAMKWFRKAAEGGARAGSEHYGIYVR